jgi:Phosphotransferase system, mannose/fructose-specific component IIA
MLGIIICTHSKYAEGIKCAISMICGEQENLDVLGFYEEDDLQAYSGKIKDIASVYETNNQKYVILVDLYGASPFNASSLAVSRFNTSIITGVNLPLVLELILQRSTYDDYDTLLENAVFSSKDSIQIVKVKEMFKNC